MEQSLSATNRSLIGIIALIGWFAIIVQFYLMLFNRVASVPETIVRFFSFFTILTNILVALSASIIFIKPQPESGFFQRSTNITAITVYIFIVGLIYNLILRFIWAPQGMQRLVDELLHLIIPILFVIYWFLFISKKELKWNNLWTWLVYPLVYIIYALIRGSFSGFYPYPFVDVNLLGYQKVLINSLGITVLFIFFSLLFIGTGRRMAGSAA
jgi:hypothetical protein